MLFWMLRLKPPLAVRAFETNSQVCLTKSKNKMECQISPPCQNVVRWEGKTRSMFFPDLLTGILDCQHSKPECAYVKGQDPVHVFSWAFYGDFRLSTNSSERDYVKGQNPVHVLVEVPVAIWDCPQTMPECDYAKGQDPVHVFPRVAYGYFRLST